MSRQVILTQDGLVKIKAELQNVIDVQLPRTEAKHKMVSYGYVKGDFEYEDSKAERDFYKKRIEVLEEMIQFAKII